MFIFQYFTGLRLSDFQTMDSKIDLHENRIIKTMQKTGKTISVPLTPLAKHIIEKYQTEEIPIISSQRYNINLKKMVGHGSVRTTKLYAKLVDGKKEKAIKELENYLQ